MGYTDRQLLTAQQVSQVVDSAIVNPLTVVGQSNQRNYTLDFLNGTAATDFTGITIVYLPFNAILISAVIVCPIAVTADATNNRTLAISKYSLATSYGTAVSLITTVTTNSAGTGNLAALTPYSFTVTAANAQCVTGDVIAFSSTHGGSGVALGNATHPVLVQLTFQEN